MPLVLNLFFLGKFEPVCKNIYVKHAHTAADQSDKYLLIDVRKFKSYRVPLNFEVKFEMRSRL